MLPHMCPLSGEGGKERRREGVERRGKRREAEGEKGEGEETDRP